MNYFVRPAGKKAGRGITRRLLRLNCATGVFACCLLISGSPAGDVNNPAIQPLKESSNPPRAFQPFEFTRLIAHWAGYADSGYLPFVDDVKPDVAQIGFYGAHFWSLADTSFGSSYPAHLPVRGHRECGDWFA